MAKPTVGVVVRPTHEGGVLINVEGPVPRLGASVILESDGTPLGRVDTILGSVANPIAHVIGIDHPPDEKTRVVFVMQQRSSKGRASSRPRSGGKGHSGYRRKEGQHRPSKNPSMAGQVRGRHRPKNRDGGRRRKQDRGSNHKGQRGRSGRGQHYRRSKR